MAVTPLTRQQREVLHSLGYLYLMHGQHKRALTLLMFATRRSRDDDAGLLRSFAYALILNKSGDQAIEVIDRLEVLERDDLQASAMLLLLRSRALLHAGRLLEARSCFSAYINAIQPEAA